MSNDIEDFVFQTIKPKAEHILSSYIGKYE